MIERPHRRAKPEKIERPRRRAHQPKIERPHRKPKSAVIIGFPNRLYFVMDEDWAAQREAERIFRELKGRCPCCRRTDDGRGHGNGCLTIQAFHGELKFCCRVCLASHDEIARRLARYLPREHHKHLGLTRPPQRWWENENESA